MRLCLASRVHRPPQSIDSAEVDSSPVPKGENNPLPEYFKAEVDAFLASSVQLWILIDVLVIDILLDGVGEETLP